MLAIYFVSQSLSFFSKRWSKYIKGSLILWVNNNFSFSVNMFSKQMTLKFFCFKTHQFQKDLILKTNVFFLQYFGNTYNTKKKLFIYYNAISTEFSWPVRLIKQKKLLTLTFLFCNANIQVFFKMLLNYLFNCSISIIQSCDTFLPPTHIRFKRKHVKKIIKNKILLLCKIYRQQYCLNT